MRKWLEEARKAHNLTKAELAETISVDISTIGKYERGERRPTVEKAKEIANVLGFGWQRFYENEAEESQ